jgi:hypothetical protein
MSAPPCGPFVIPPACNNLAAALLLQGESAAPQVIPQGVLDDVQFLTGYELGVIDADEANDRIIIGATGIYLVGVGITILPGGTGQVVISVTVNNGPPPTTALSVVVAVPIPLQFVREFAAFPVPLNAGDEVRLSVLNSTDAGVAIVSAALAAGACLG